MFLRVATMFLQPIVKASNKGTSRGGSPWTPVISLIIDKDINGV